ncbi:MAG: AAA domain-containing protein [Planctomycetota bacterium]|jgi:hypothetical protein
MSETTYNLEEAKARITRVFKYLQELHRVKTPPTVHLDRYAWRFDLDALPSYSTVQRGSLLSKLDLHGRRDDPQSGDFIVKVARPQETECPPPSVIIQQWLHPGWDEPGAEPQVFAKRRSKSSGREESFEDSRDRVTALEQWLDIRRQWAVSEKKVTDALDIFSSLFDLWGRFARESEKYQLYVGDGILVMERPEGAIWHPLLLQRVNLHFNPSVPEFTIRESRDFPHIYTPLLRHLGVDGKDLHELGKEVFKQHIHPLGGEPTSLFYKGLVQRLWQDGHYFENQDEVTKTTGPYIYRHPLIYLGGSNQGFAEAIDRFLEYVHSATELPEALLRVCGIETGREYHSRDDETPHTVDLLLTKNANPEQELVIHRLEETGTVLVQGPPGTGKSHTIANLIGHLLAQNKSILVTSHTSKALRIVREQVAAPLRSLCVSVFYSDEESNKELEESITGIVNYISTTSQKKLNREIEQLSEKRDALKARHAELRRSLLDAMTDEYRDIQIGDELIDPSSAARRLIDFEHVHDWIPGPVEENAELPLSEKELRDLYAVTAKVSEEGEQLVSAPLPDHEKLPSPQEFAAIFDDINRLEQKALKSGSEHWLHENQTPEMLEEVLATMQAAVEVLDVEDEWLLECFDAGRQAEGERDSWMALVRLIEECCQEIPPREELILAHGPKVNLSKPLGELVTTPRSTSRSRSASLSRPAPRSSTTSNPARG